MPPNHKITSHKLVGYCHLYEYGNDGFRIWLRGGAAAPEGACSGVWGMFPGKVSKIRPNILNSDRCGAIGKSHCRVLCTLSSLGDEHNN